MNKKKKISDKPFFSSNLQIKWLILIGIIILFTVVYSPSLVTQKHSYKFGDVVQADIKAPIDFFVEDTETTEAKRIQALESVQTVYDHNTILSVELSKRIDSAFNDLRTIRKLESDKLSLEATNEKNSSKADILEPTLPIQQQAQQMKNLFAEKIGIPVSDGAYKVLEKENFSTQISNLIIKILTEILANGVVANKEILLREAEKGILLRNIETKEETVTYNLKQFYGLDQAKTMVRVIGQPLLKDMNYTLLNLVVDFVQLLIQPNITPNRNETEERKIQATNQVKPVLYKIKAGEMLLREGERVNQMNLLKLEALQVQSKKVNLLPRVSGAAMIVLCLLLIYYILNRNLPCHLKCNSNKNLLFIGCILILFLLLARLSAYFSSVITQNALYDISVESFAFGLPLAAGSMIVCLFMGLDLALSFALILSVCVTIIFKNRFDIFIYFLLSSTMAAYWMRYCRERNVFIKAGVKLGLLNMAFALFLDVYMGDYSGFKIFWDLAFSFLGGIGAGIVTAGLAPLFEISFSYMTDIKLLELANLDRPILRRLLLEAPGTYHHSVIVGTMVEAAALEINANPLLAKACGYYHDIGKINKPQYFIENQQDEKNKHDKLAPSMSKHILVSHVKDGVEIGKENKLGQAILDTIKQHHGTSVISYFYEKAKKLQGSEAVNDNDYRYPGPKPQTKEAALVLLADVVEASSRTLDNPTPSRIQGHVQGLIYKLFTEGQLDECDLTLKDLNAIAKNFIKIINGIYHHRIEYLESARSEREDGKNGSSHKKQAEKIQDISEKDSKKSAIQFKRLGLS